MSDFGYRFYWLHSRRDALEVVCDVPKYHDWVIEMDWYHHDRDPEFVYAVVQR